MNVVETRIADISQTINTIVSIVACTILCMHPNIKHFVTIQIQVESGTYVFILIAKSAVTKMLLCEVNQNDCTIS